MSIYKNFTNTKFDIWKSVESLTIQDLKDILIEVNLMIFQIEQGTLEGVYLDSIKDYRQKVSAELFSKLEKDYISNQKVE